MIRGTAGFRKRSREQGPKDNLAQESAGEGPAVERCALLPLGDGQALLHVLARWTPDAPEGVVLLSAGAGSPHRPIAPGARVNDDGLWSASFAIAADAADGRLLLATPAVGPWMLPRPELAEA